MKKNLLTVRMILGALFVLFLYNSGIAQTLPYTLENNSTYSDNQIYIAIVGITGGHVWVDPVTGAVHEMNVADNTVAGPVIDGNLGPGGNGLYADCFRPLSQIPNHVINIPQISGCRIFISFNSQLYLYFFGYSGSPSGYAAPNLDNPTDPNQGIKFEIIELTYNNLGLWCNTTRVDAYQYPLGLEVWGSGFYKKVGELKTHQEIISEWQATAPSEFQGLLDASQGIIHFPTKSSTFPQSLIQGYIDQVWSKYTGQQLVFNSGDAGTWRGSVSGSNFVFTRDSDGQVATIPGKPTTVEAMEASGVMASGAQWDLVVQAQIAAAINRHAIDLNLGSGAMQDFSNAALYYQTWPYNWYAKFWHRTDISFEGYTYAFSFDDVFDQSATIHTPSPTNITITVGGFAGSVNPPEQSPYAGVIQIPGTVEMENYDNGGEGVAYHDADANNKSNTYRFEGVDIEACTEGGYNIDWSVSGEWLEYTVNVANSATYTMNVRVASPIGGSCHVEFDGSNVSGLMNVPNTGGWQNWQTISTPVNLSAGQHIMRFFIDQQEFNTNYISFDAQSTPGNLPTPWASSDIGAVGSAGSASYSNGTYTLIGSGADIWGTSDEFRYAYQQVSGDVTITARVASLTNTDGWAKAGVMIRNDLNANSAHAFTAVTAGNGTAFQRRTSAGGESSHTAGPSGTAPYWVRLQRSGSTFTSYVSTNGSSWTQVGSQSFSMNNTVYVGLAVTSHSDGALCTAPFDNVDISTGSGTIPVTGVSVSPTSISLAVGGSQQLAANVSPSNATNQSVSWSSSNSGVASVNSNGLVTANAAGSATITVTTADGGYTANCSVSVSGGTSGDDITNLGGSVTSQYTDWPSGEGITNLIDNNVNTKYLTFHNAAWVQYQSTGSYIVTSYSITSANDVPDRDPRDWNLQGSNDGVNWTALDTRSGEDFPNRFQTRTFSFSNSAAFTYYRFNMNNNAGNILQLAEIELFGTPGGTPGFSVLIEAENYASMSGIQTESCSEGGLNVGWIDAGDWMVWDVNLPASGTYTVEYRVASLSAGGTIEFERAGGSPDYGTINVPVTGGWQNWTTISHTVTLDAGAQQVAINVLAGGWNINWLQITQGVKAAETIGNNSADPPALILYPNPATHHLIVEGIAENSVIDIFNVSGERVIHTRESRIDVSSLAPGIYTAQIISNGSVISEMFIKQ